MDRVKDKIALVTGARRGLATMCVGVGQGTAVLVSR